MLLILKTDSCKDLCLEIKAETEKENEQLDNIYTEIEQQNLEAILAKGPQSRLLIYPK